MASDISSVIAAAAVTVTAIAGRNALKSWRDKKNLKRKMNNVEHTYWAIQNVRESLSRIRHPVVQDHENDAAMAILNEMRKEDDSIKVNEERILGIVHRNRLNLEEECYTTLKRCIFFADLDLGDGAKAALNDVIEVFDAISLAAGFLIGHKSNTSKGYIKRWKETIRLHSGGKEIEKISIAYKSMIKIEDICTSILKAEDL